MLVADSSPVLGFSSKDMVAKEHLPFHLLPVLPPSVHVPAVMGSLYFLLYVSDNFVRLSFFYM